MKRFIVFTDEELFDILGGKAVPIKDLPGVPYDIYCVSEDWMRQYDNEDDLP